MSVKLSIEELKLLLGAYTSTHTRLKSFGSSDGKYRGRLFELGLIHAHKLGDLGDRTTSLGDQMVERVLQATRMSHENP